MPGLLAALLPEPGDQRLDCGGLLGDREQGAGALHDLPAYGRTGGDPLGRGGGGQRRLCPVPAQHVDGQGIADDGDVHDPLEQRGLRAKAHVDGARTDLGPPGDRLQGSGHVPVGHEQFGSGGDDPLLGLPDLRLPQRRQVLGGGLRVDILHHVMQSNCNGCTYTALEGLECQTHPFSPGSIT
jgi:hypothetical protein